MRWIATAALLCAALPTGAQAGRVVRITIDNAAIRSGPSDTYDRVAVLPAGLKLPVISREGGWYRVALGELLQPYVHSSIVTLLPEGAAPSQGRVTDLSTGGFPKGTRVTLSLTAPVPYRIIQRLRPAALVLELFNCRLAQYGVRQRAGDDLVLAIEQVQLSANTTQITFHLPQKQQTGYEARFEGDALILDIRRPYQTGELRGKLIGLDPGHGGADPGACGETGLKEKNADLDIALRLKPLLEQAGAQVCLTRQTDVNLCAPGDPLAVQLHARRTLTKRAGCDLFLSVHNNDIGDGGDRHYAYGTETYYWTPMSVLPARCVQKAVCAALGTNFRFTSWRPFYVLRETDCPRLLVECAYVSHPKEEAELKSADFRQRAAQGIFAGLQEFFGLTATTDGLEPEELTPSIGTGVPPG
jgi:N-acetylmuramoyl-L-alanine amidase